MSRLTKYKESLVKFIKERSCLLENLNKPKIEPILYSRVKKSDMLMPIVALTIMNNQNKKKNITIQGYYIASSIEFMHILLDIFDNKEDYIKQYTLELYNILINHLIWSINNSLCQNVESIRLSLHTMDISDMYIQLMKTHNEIMSCNNFLSEPILKQTNDIVNEDTLKWYIRENVDLKDKFKKIKKVEMESYNDYLNKRVCNLSEYTFVVSWIISGGEITKLDQIKRVSKYFGILYKLMVDFDSIDSDIVNSKEMTKNHVINYGLQVSYELFMYNKQKFIEEAMLLDIYTNTVQEIIEYIEKRVDEFVDNTSPDLKSLASTNL